MRYIPWMLAILMLTACSDDPDSKAKNNGFDLGEPDIGVLDQGGIDQGLDAGDMGASSAIVFRMENATSQTLFAGQAAGTGDGCFQESWLSIAGTDSTPTLSDSCAICNCDDTECAVCVFDCGLENADVLRLDPGQERTFTWNKQFWEMQFLRQGQCQLPVDASAPTYTALFCFGDDILIGDATDRLSRRLCKTVEFDLNDDVVEVSITDNDLPESLTTIRLVNGSGNELYAQPAAANGGGYCYQSWFTLLDSDTTLRVTNQCETCDCDQLSGGVCQVACPDIACAAPTREILTLPAGEAREYQWDLTYFTNATIGEQVCENPQYMLGEMLTARICWGTRLDDSGGFASITNESCQDVSFQAGQDVVEIVVSAAP